MIYQNLGCLNSYLLLSEASHQRIGEEKSVDDLMVSSPEKLIFERIRNFFSVLRIHFSHKLLDNSWDHRLLISATVSVRSMCQVTLEV